MFAYVGSVSSLCSIIYQPQGSRAIFIPKTLLMTATFLIVSIDCSQFAVSLHSLLFSIKTIPSFLQLSMLSDYHLFLKQLLPLSFGSMWLAPFVLLEHDLHFITYYHNLHDKPPQWIFLPWPLLFPQRSHFLLSHRPSYPALQALISPLSIIPNPSTVLLPLRQSSTFLHLSTHCFEPYSSFPSLSSSSHAYCPSLYLLSDDR